MITLVTVIMSIPYLAYPYPTLSESKVQHWLCLAQWITFHLLQQGSRLKPTWRWGWTWQWLTNTASSQSGTGLDNTVLTWLIYYHLSDQLRDMSYFVLCPHHLGYNMCYSVTTVSKYLYTHDLHSRDVAQMYLQAWVFIATYEYACIHLEDASVVLYKSFKKPVDIGTTDPCNCRQERYQLSYATFMNYKYV
jgi:hypothetical protein